MKTKTIVGFCFLLCVVVHGAAGAVRVLNLSDSEVTFGRAWGMDGNGLFARGGRSVPAAGVLDLELSDIVAEDGQIAFRVVGPELVEFVSVRDGGAVVIGPNYRLTVSAPPLADGLSVEEQIQLFFAGAGFIAPLLVVMLVIRYAKKGATVTTD